MEDLKENGFCIIKGVLNSDEVTEARRLFFEWQKTVPNHDNFHDIFDPYGIYKYHQIGHQEHAWYIRTNPKVIEIFKKLWNCEELAVSFDGTNYMSPNFHRKDSCWAHTDQSSKKKGLCCYQGFVSLTDNEEKTFVAYEGSHKLHQKYFEDLGIEISLDWFVIDKEYMNKISHLKRVLKVEKGDLVLWDSRTFHQNQFGNPSDEERLVQYVCYFPKSYNESQERLECFNKLRTTTHWPYPIQKVGLQPDTWDKRFFIDYSKLRRPDLDRFREKILELI